MLLYEPPPSAGDLHFRLFGFPVRVHLFFWIGTALLGLNGNPRPEMLLLWLAVVFVSILVHELGHAFAQRYYGGHPWITLHGLGGLASCDDCDRRPSSQIIISLAGPAAGFLLAGATMLAVRMSDRAIGVTTDIDAAMVSSGIEAARLMPLLGVTLYWEPYRAAFANALVSDLLWVNIVWGLVNLLPIYPLDGGRVSRELFTLDNPRQGIIQSLRLSIAAAAAMAFVGLLLWQSVYTALMFGYLAYTSYRTLEAYQYRGW